MPKRSEAAAFRPEAHRYITREGHINVKRHGWRDTHPGDLYHWLMRISWGEFVLVISGLYLAINLVFAALYYPDLEHIRNARPGSFADAFFFSMQTLATIGYGHMVPDSLYTDWVVTVESLVALFNMAFVTGIVFSRVARPSARVMFSHFAVIAPHDGVPTLMFRAANRRGNQILQATMRVTLTRNERTLEGETVRRVHDLKLGRDYTSFFSLPWTVRHAIDSSSPFFGETPESLKASESELVVLLSGIDDTFGRTVHGRFAYNHEEILFGHRFVNMFLRDADNNPTVDYSRFDEIELVPA